MIIGVSGKQQSGKDFVATIIQNFGPGWKVIKFADKVKDIVCLMIGCSRADLENNDFKNKELGEEWRVWKVQVIDNGPEIFASAAEANAYCDMYDVAPYDYETELLTPRKLLQLVGTEAGRNIIHPNVWINATMANYIAYSARGSEYEFEESKWIITDLRFPNEAQAIRDRGGITIRLERSIIDRCPELARKYILYLHSQRALNDLGTTVELQFKELDFMQWLRRFENKQYENMYHVSETSLDTYEKFDYVVKNDTAEELITDITNILKD